MNGQSFSCSRYPQLARAYPGCKLPDLRGVFIRGWDNGRGLDGDRNRHLLSYQADQSGVYHERGGWLKGSQRYALLGPGKHNGNAPQKHCL
ncbi:minor pilin subunit [Escherichia coli]|uniref:Minor pilin subunit n=1 Tax=Escherichia coli TaxID=562 RepID=A0A376VUQ2_ECOLX|nr:minor pilin subunit [Escherichia coli]